MAYGYLRVSPALHQCSFFAASVLCRIVLLFPAVATGLQPSSLRGSVHRLPQNQSRQLVLARWHEDVDWVHNLPSFFDVTIYQSGNESSLHYVPNFGNEATKYLAYIVDNYYHLPQTVSFVQAGRQDWHDPLPKDVSLPLTDPAAAVSAGGFSFLPGSSTCWFVQFSNHVAGASDNSSCINLQLSAPDELTVIKRLWKELLQAQLGSPPDRWYTACCAQFQVTREAIQRHPAIFYRHLLNWLSDLDADLRSDLRDDPEAAVHPEEGHSMKDNHDPLERDAGHVMEVIWPLLFSDQHSNSPGSAPAWLAASTHLH